jgi:hypothetical protein
MKTDLLWLLGLAALAPPLAPHAASNQLLGWNNGRNLPRGFYRLTIP